MPKYINRRWLLHQTPRGRISQAYFRENTVVVDTDTMQFGDVLFRNIVVSCDPAQRTWLTGTSYIPQVQPGDVMPAQTLMVVEYSRNESWVPGDMGTGTGCWQEYYLWRPGQNNDKSKPANDWDKQRQKYLEGFRKVSKISQWPSDIPKEMVMSLTGTTGLTAYVGLKLIGKIQPGSRVLVSGAAGSTGSFVGQLAKALGASRVVGVAGGPDKCKWLTETAGFDAAVDYKKHLDSGREPNRAKRIHEMSAALRATCPEGFDVYFDNVGGEVLEAALSNIRKGARIVLCGAISQYNVDVKDQKQTDPGPRNLSNLIMKGASMSGFLVMDYQAHFKDAIKDMTQLYRGGRIKVYHDVAEGFEQLPTALCSMLDGQNVGKQLCKL